MKKLLLFAMLVLGLGSIQAEIVSATPWQLVESETATPWQLVDDEPTTDWSLTYR
ncbi:MAG: hypothetical protein P4L22_07245 [Candidatus Babeliales bacterium]|nr:hypothetical protein [Candidatus Babeliales bacterium]